MTTILGLLGSAWPYIASAVLAVGSLLTAFVVKKSADTKVAKADQRVAEANQATAEAKAQTATVRDGESQANAAAAAAGANSVKERANVEIDVASLPAGAAAGQLLDEWAAPTGAASAAGSAGQDANH
ncbi:hypothetical protein [Bordetella genomosp. 9]|uniref:hypothetical protein n=1 Tax=Bordetella genomosp. 9 TaxID=1416803 RepID=UPI0015C5EF2F|nr:hypothetical protein [Bordetella genomosp. 9]